jgi:hypothetical protein
VPVCMYGAPVPGRGIASIGHRVRAEVRRFGRRVPQEAYDFLTVALAVTAADTFVNRENAADGWARDIELLVRVGSPAPWSAVTPILEEALKFLSGDTWKIVIQPNGPQSPPRQTRGRLVNMAGRDCVSLFSGGLDSAIGALDLLGSGRRPLLVSHSYKGDSSRQEDILRMLPDQPSRFAANATPHAQGTYDITMRTRSLNFIAYGAVAASELAVRGTSQPLSLFVPENGQIALNPPLTMRRLGTLSTRTTHPHYLDLIQQVLDGLGIPAHIENPYALMTKGEMLKRHRNWAPFAGLAAHTVSCGKWKRRNQQCGRCVPCLIRRAAFHASNIVDATPYSSPDLGVVMANEHHRDDLLAMVLAVRKARVEPISPWVALSGPLPIERAERDALVDVVRRGMAEMEDYLGSLGLVDD